MLGATERERKSKLFDTEPKISRLDTVSVSDFKKASTAVCRSFCSGRSASSPRRKSNSSPLNEQVSFSWRTSSVPISSGETISCSNSCSISSVKGLLFTGSSLIISCMAKMFFSVAAATVGSLSMFISSALVSSRSTSPLFCFRISVCGLVLTTFVISCRLNWEFSAMSPLGSMLCVRFTRGVVIFKISAIAAPPLRRCPNP